MFTFKYYLYNKKLRKFLRLKKFNNNIGLFYKGIFHPFIPNPLYNYRWTKKFLHAFFHEKQNVYMCTKSRNYENSLNSKKNPKFFVMVGGDR